MHEFLSNKMAISSYTVIHSSSSLNQATCNKVIKQEVLHRNSNKAISTYIHFQQNGFNPDNFTFPILLKINENPIRLTIHGQTIKTGFSSHIFVQTALINMYVSMYCIDGASKVFDRMGERDLVSLNSMLDAYICCGELRKAVELFESMGHCKDCVSFNVLISGLGKNGEILLARKVFDGMVARDVVSWNSMIMAYVNRGDMEEACKLFDQMPEKSVVTWNTMIAGYLSGKRFSDAIDLFFEMEGSEFTPDYVTVTSALSACAHLGLLEKGKKLHIYAKIHGLESNLHVITSLIDMYAKCGHIKNSLSIFYKSKAKDIYCWNAIISSLALHGYGRFALKMFETMREIRMEPDDITFIGLLSACSHSGLVQEGCDLLLCMQNEYRIKPKLEHYGCIVDLLARAGFLDLTIQLAEDMPFEQGDAIWSALLSACVIHRDLELGKKVWKMMLDKGRPMSDGEFMTMANLCSSCGQWEESDRWRNAMNKSGIVKSAGYSGIEISGRTCKFLAGEFNTEIINNGTIIYV